MSDSARKEELSFLGNILNKIKFKMRAVFPNTSNSTGFTIIQAADGPQAGLWNSWPILLDPVRRTRKTPWMRYSSQHTEGIEE